MSKWDCVQNLNNSKEKRSVLQVGLCRQNDSDGKQMKRKNLNIESDLKGTKHTVNTFKLHNQP